MSETKLIDSYLNREFSTVDKFLSDLDSVMANLKKATDNANLEVNTFFFFFQACCYLIRDRNTNFFGL
jgi:hypothetical protein